MSDDLLDLVPPHGHGKLAMAPGGGRCLFLPRRGASCCGRGGRRAGGGARRSPSPAASSSTARAGVGEEGPTDFQLPTLGEAAAPARRVDDGGGSAG